ncbi:MAG: pilus assembly FimT family protein [Patescibacteria group bacterium]
MKLTHSLKAGFTFIELLVVMGVILLLTSGIIAGYNNFTDNQRLKQTALTLKTNLRFAQTKAASADKPTSGCTQLVGYAVSFTNSSYNVQAQCSEGLVGSLTSVSLPVGISFSPIPETIVFRVLTRGTTSDNPVTLTLIGRLKSYRLEVSPKGDITDLGFQ